MLLVLPVREEQPLFPKWPTFSGRRTLDLCNWHPQLIIITQTEAEWGGKRINKTSVLLQRRSYREPACSPLLLSSS